MTKKEMLKHIEEIELNIIIINAICCNSITQDNEESCIIDEHCTTARKHIDKMKKELK